MAMAEPAQFNLKETIGGAARLISGVQDSMTRSALALRIFSFIDRSLRHGASRNGSEQPERDPEFEKLALSVFQYQYDRCAPFRSLCQNRGIASPEDVRDWRDIPLVPTSAFKLHRVACFEPSDEEVAFHTSGTTDGKPGVHAMPDTDLYDAAALAWFSNALVEPDTKYRFLSLTGTPRQKPHSSLVHMIRTAGGVYGIEGRVRYFWNEGALDLKGLASAIAEARKENAPVMLLTTAFALVQCLDACEGGGPDLSLPPGSKIMETGGFKGRSRTLEKTDLYERTSQLFGVPVRRIINEYGMTEMSSQFYDAVEDEASEEDIALGPRIKIPPPWVRSIVLDPVTLEPVAEGENGVLAHVDLANLDSCAFLLTADAARRVGKGFELFGRMGEVEARGCSLDYEIGG